MSFHAPIAGQPRPTQHAHVLSRSSLLFGNSLRGGRRFKQAFEVLAEAGDVAVADGFGDAGDGEPLQDGAQLLELLGRGGGVSGRMASGERRAAKPSSKDRSSESRRSSVGAWHQYAKSGFKVCGRGQRRVDLAVKIETAIQNAFDYPEGRNLCQIKHL